MEGGLRRGRPAGAGGDRGRGAAVRQLPDVLAVPREGLTTDWRLPFLVLSATWGSSFLFIAVALRDFTPLQVSTGRVLLGAVALVALLLARGERLPRDRGLWRRLVVVGLLLNALPYTLFAYGQTHISSVLAGLWNATTPLLTLLAVLVAFREEQPRREAVLGLVVGFAGAVVVLGPWEGLGGGALVGSLACLAATACYGIGIPYARRHVVGTRSESMVALAAAQLLVSSALLLLVVPFGGPLPDDVDPAPLASLVALGALGTGIAFALSNSVLRVAGATVASTVTYVIPLFSTALGVLVLDEDLRWNEPVGALVVLAGVALGQRRRTETVVETTARDD